MVNNFTRFKNLSHAILDEHYVLNINRSGSLVAGQLVQYGKLKVSVVQTNLSKALKAANTAYIRLKDQYRVLPISIGDTAERSLDNFIINNGGSIVIKSYQFVFYATTIDWWGNTKNFTDYSLDNLLSKIELYYLNV